MVVMIHYLDMMSQRLMEYSSQMMVLMMGMIHYQKVMSLMELMMVHCIHCPMVLMIRYLVRLNQMDMMNQHWMVQMNRLMEHYHYLV
jgi:hypothetical protein